MAGVAARSLRKLVKTPKQIFILITGILVICLCGSTVYFVLLIFAAEPLARTLAPPEYPGSEMLGRWYSGGTDTMWDRRTYHTPDDILTVLEFMETNMPGFEQTDRNINGEVAYSNGECLNNWAGRQIAMINMGDPDYIDNPSFPCVLVWISQDSDLSPGTYIEVWLDWPAP